MNNRYIIKCSNNQYFATGKNNGTYTNDVNKAHIYLILQQIDNAIINQKKMNSELFKGGKVIDLDTGEIVKNIRWYDRIVIGSIISETPKAILVKVEVSNKDIWLPKTQIELYENNEIGLSDWLWEQNFGKTDNIKDLESEVV